MNSSDTYRQALSCAVKHIGIATYSSGKIRVYLIEHGFSEDVAGAVVSELIEREYINDRKASRKVLISRTGKKQDIYILIEIFINNHINIPFVSNIIIILLIIDFIVGFIFRIFTQKIIILRSIILFNKII